jgi:dTDP-glucose 4,6-dehydratase
MTRRTWLVTGCLGFLARPLVERLLAKDDWVVGLDARTYAANIENLQDWESHDNFRFIHQRIEDLANLPRVDVVVHLAAETHVDNAAEDPRRFVHTNVVGTLNLLELLRAKRAYERPLLVHVSTDEVYGDDYEGAVDERAPLRPGNPYAASKAGADHLVQSWGRSFGLAYRIVRPSNCYGFDQYPEKLIPKAIECLHAGKPIPIHGDGSQERTWLSVQDCATAILKVAEAGENGGIYNIPGNTTCTVKEVVTAIVAAFDGSGVGLSYGHERLGSDRRYEVGGAALLALGWKPIGNLFADLPGIVKESPPVFRL